MTKSKPLEQGHSREILCKDIHDMVHEIQRGMSRIDDNLDKRDDASHRAAVYMQIILNVTQGLDKLKEKFCD